jgi:hypothetical protein
VRLLAEAGENFLVDSFFLRCFRDNLSASFNSSAAANGIQSEKGRSYRAALFVFK